MRKAKGHFSESAPWHALESKEGASHLYPSGSSAVRGGVNAASDRGDEFTYRWSIGLISRFGGPMYAPLGRISRL